MGSTGEKRYYWPSDRECRARQKAAHTTWLNSISRKQAGKRR